MSSSSCSHDLANCRATERTNERTNELYSPMKKTLAGYQYRHRPIKAGHQEQNKMNSLNRTAEQNGLKALYQD